LKEIRKKENENIYLFAATFISLIFILKNIWQNLSEEGSFNIRVKG
jgi:predicted rRNA methylase YqxC with S4 and FtsJ domains